MEKRTFVLGMIAGFGLMLFVASIPGVESAIPPTRAFSIIQICNVSATDNAFNVTSDSYADIIHFVSDGSISFNVTDTPP